MDPLFEHFFPEEIHHAKLWHLNTFVIPAAARRCRARDIAISKPHQSYAMIAVAASASSHMYDVSTGGRRERGLNILQLVSLCWCDVALKVGQELTPLGYLYQKQSCYATCV